VHAAEFTPPPKLSEFYYGYGMLMAQKSILLQLPPPRGNFPPEIKEKKAHTTN